MALRRVIVTALLMLAVASSSRAEVNLSFLVGIRDEADSDRLPAVGLGGDFGAKSWPLHPEIGVQLGVRPLYPGNETEVSLGVVHYWQLSRFRLDLGAGAVSLASSFGYNEGSTQGAYLHGGVVWSREDYLSYGIDFRFMKLDDLEVDGDSYRVGYQQLAFLMRWQWRRNR